jgi:hypothetical protein
MTNATCFVRWLLASGGTIALLAGCGSGVPMGEVTGIVTVAGAPAANLQILFEPRDGTRPSSIGFTDAQGKYQLQCSNRRPGAIVGLHVIRVTGMELDGGGPPLEIPAKYSTASELTLDVKSGPNTFNIEIVRTPSGSPTGASGGA